MPLLASEAHAIRLRQVLRFLISGGLNTLLTWAAYVLLLQVMPYHLSYTVAYGFGVLLAYIFFRYYVFRRSGGGNGLFWVFCVYMLQYLLGLTLVNVWVQFLQAPAIWAPLVATAFSLPVVFLLSSFVFRER